MTESPLDGFRDHLAEISPERSERMRSRVVAFVDADPSSAASANVADRSPDAQRASTADLLELYPAQHTRRRQPRVLLVAAAAVLVVLLAGLAILGRQRGTVTADQPAPLPSPTLRQLADNAGRQSDQPLPDGKSAFRATRFSPSETGGEETEEAWLAADGKGRVQRTPVSGLLSSRTSGTTGAPLVNPVDNARLFDGLSYDELRSLPTDPVPLRAELERSAKTKDVAAIATLAVRLMSWTVTPPSVRAGGLQLLDSLGYQASGPSTVNAQSGPSWTVTDVNGNHTVVFDAGTARPIASFDSPSDASPGDSSAATQWVVFERAAVSDPPA